MNWKVLAAGALIVIPLVTVLAMGFGQDPRALPNVMEGRTAPQFHLSDLDGMQSYDLAELAGKPVVLNFWASWCVPCAQEHPWLIRTAQQYEPRGVVFLGVLYGDEAVNGKAFLKRNGHAFPTLLDPGGHSALDYGVAGVPETFVISPQGQIVHKFVGPIEPDLMTELLERML